MNLDPVSVSGLVRHREKRAAGYVHPMEALLCGYQGTRIGRQDREFPDLSTFLYTGCMSDKDNPSTVQFIRIGPVRALTHSHSL